ncbi:putative Ig domain-containing protein [Leptospira haakeii]|uniref:Uncharacterized protein n=1 Tax=Leptospira haakeii TaxID=2023198 RepID=A0ABX4PLY7_9LEPT|nr:putative Ig domain-containing protein [Leptospira haakeii]PKA15712.1 hypothetical protein CH363_11905 [Leptospira haakeii]PKA21798.1 hypothetical protein CH377_05505 [Leptospira haakeii]
MNCTKKILLNTIHILLLIILSLNFQACGSSSGSPISKLLTSFRFLFGSSENRAPLISYQQGAYTFSLSETIYPIELITGGNGFLDCTATPELPTGMTLDTNSCGISGTPSGIKSPANYTITATNSYGSSQTVLNITVNNLPPSALNYHDAPFTFSQNVLLQEARPTVTGTVTGCTSSPSLPSGLSLHPQTCAISGKPVSSQSPSDYTITASNSYGNTQTSINIRVTLSAPSALNYSNSPFVLTQFETITPFTPSYSGTITSCTSFPGLPNGLSIDQNNCSISGNPTDLQNPTNYTITASNSVGNTSTKISIQVNVAPPSSLNYAGSTYVFTKGATISTVTPTITGTVTSCTANPSLPSGLGINSTTCAISGTPSVEYASTNFTITASNSSGSTQAIIGITINLAAPSSLNYAGSPYVFTQNLAILKITPSVTGTITNCSVSPSLPSGLALNANTCAISGTPVYTQSATNYTVTASNSGGSTQATITITVNIAPPGSLKYLTGTYTLTQNTTISTITPSYTGTITNCTSSPDLPTGLALNTSNCAISGTPTTPQSTSTYTITASNSVGSTQTSIIMRVNLAPPSIVYSGSPYTLSFNQTMSTITPTVTGTVASCSISPALPSGLGINTTTCAISGTPGIVQTAKNYTITATNSAGSTQAVITITINLDPPSNLSYSGSPFTFTQFATISAISPSVTGTVTSCGTSPALPNGLGINSVNCTISGTPMVSQSAVTYTVTAGNSKGSTQTTISIEVNLSPPKIIYSESYLSMTKNNEIMPIFPKTMGTVNNCSSSPNLPQGLGLSSDCSISGTPTTSQGPTNYTITASNSAGSYQTTITISVGTNWAQEAYIKASNSDLNDYFGNSIAVSGDIMVVGTNYESSNQTTITNGNGSSSNNSAPNAGAAYVYTRSGNSWSQEAYLKAPNAEANDNFGASVAISGNTIVVGAYGEDSSDKTITNGPTASSNNDKTSAGAAYVFVKSGNTWSQQAYLKAPDATANDNFGYSVSISGDTIVVGANPGPAYVYVRSGNTWSHQATLTSSNLDSFDFYATSVSISGDTIVVGAYGEDSNQKTITNGSTASSNNSLTDSGAAYVYVRSGNTWSQQAYLKAPNAKSTDHFGHAVAISGDTIAVGAPTEFNAISQIVNGGTIPSVLGSDPYGAVYVFTRSGSNWSFQSYIKPSNMDPGDFFGDTVSISGDTIVVGSPAEDSNQASITNGTTASSNNSYSDSGAAYVFVRSGTNWTQQAYLKSPNIETLDRFGESVSVSGDTIVIGAVFEDSNLNTVTNGTGASSDNSTSASGAAFVIRRQ